MGDKQDLAGQTFGLWTVLAVAPPDTSGRRRWRCRCACGAETEVAAGNLLSGYTTSCGCALSAAQQSTVARVEGLQNSPRTGAFETNIRAKSWVLTDGRRAYEIRNLSKFVREHTELLGIGPDPVSIKRALRGLFDAAQKKYKWFGWSISQVNDATR